MSKQPHRMTCAVCRRPLDRAAALLKGLPVGPVCALKQGLIGGRRSASQGELDLVTASKTTVVVPCTQTIDMFAAP